jgi:hypothetical protein
MLRISPISITIISRPQNMRRHARFRALAYVMLEIKSSGMLRHAESSAYRRFEESQCLYLQGRAVLQSKADVAPASKACCYGLQKSWNTGPDVLQWHNVHTKFSEIDWQVKLKYARTSSHTHKHTHKDRQHGDLISVFLSLCMKDSMSQMVGIARPA